MRNVRVVVSRYGGPEVLGVAEEERPVPGPGEARVRVLAAGVALPDVLAREGIHPETPPVPFTPGWDLVGVVDEVGEGVKDLHPGQAVAAMPIHGAYAGYVCLPARELVPVPAGVDAAEAVCLVLNYVTAYQMMHRSVKVRPGQRILVRGASGGVGTALLQLARLAGLEAYGTCSARSAPIVSELGATPIDYQGRDPIEEVRRLTGDGVDVVFDPLGGPHLWHSRRALRPGGTVVGYGLIGSMRGDGLASSRPGRRQRFRGTAAFAAYIVAGLVLPGRRRVVPYSIQTLKRLRPGWFREDLLALLDLLRERRIQPIVAGRFPLAEARSAHERLVKGGVAGKLVLVTAGASGPAAG